MPRTPIYVPDPPEDCAYTLLATDGTQLIRWGRSITRTDVRDALATDGVQRTTRAVSERFRRGYSVNSALLSREEMDVINAAVIACRGCAGVLAWRHPQDDEPGTAEDAPRWRIRNGGEGEMTFGRTTGGQFGSLVVELQEM